MAALDLTGARWRKSTRSGTNGNCVEVGPTPTAIGVRDTKDQGRGPVLAFTRPGWAAFVAAAKAGQFNL